MIQVNLTVLGILELARKLRQTANGIVEEAQHLRLTLNGSMVATRQFHQMAGSLEAARHLRLMANGSLEVVPAQAIHNGHQTVA